MSDTNKWRVTLRRSNGRFVKESRKLSKYAAKQLRDKWEHQYDDGYYVEIALTK